ncbi:hypothetical protein [Streptomyces beigongshangae]|uniref:hypothetical protein n=1 Tax=Streptomyces beigongshangae TaxID=2841597 RepID=UPI003D311BFA
MSDEPTGPATPTGARPDSPDRSGGPDRPGRTRRTVAPGERGALRVTDRVVAKIARQAAREALGPPPSGAAPPHTTVVVHRDLARVGVGLELGYPCDIGARCGAVRRRVAERVEALAGMKVPEVAVRVERLHPAPAGGAARGRTR